ncbi:hypothetical protein PFISCL1PPCAC_26450, partial [Pristionchus fissidentatus]
GWICRPYRYNENVVKFCHYALWTCKILNPIAAVYLYWAERYQMGVDMAAKRSMGIFFLLCSLYALAIELTKWSLEYYFGYWVFVKRFLHVEETLISLHYSIFLLLLLLAFDEFRADMKEWFAF